MSERVKTTYLDLIKPQYVENADIYDINGNMDIIDVVIKDLDLARQKTTSVFAPEFNPSTANESGEYVTYASELYLLPNGHAAGTNWAGTTKIKKTVIDAIAEPTREFADEIETLQDALGLIGELTDYGTSCPLIIEDTIGTLVRLEFSTASSYLLSGKNLCDLGTKTFTQMHVYDLPFTLPAGTYTFSAQVTTGWTGMQLIPVQFYNGSSGCGSGEMSIQSSGRSHVTITATAPFNSIYLFSADSWAHGSGIEATYTNIQLELGSSDTSYEAYSGSIKSTSVNSFTSTASKTCIISNDGSNIHAFSRSSTPNPVIPQLQDDIEDLQDDIGDLNDGIDALHDETDELKSNNPPWQTDSQTTGVDLDVADGDGNVILRLKDGDIITKNFDSSDYAGIPDDVDELLEDMDDVKKKNPPEQTDSTEEEVDLDICDGNGNVIMRLADGGIITKNFDSSDYSDLPAEVNDIKRRSAPEETDSLSTGVDLDIADENGNVLMRLSNGHVYTKYFNSENASAAGAVETFDSGNYTYTAGSSNTITIEAPFTKGDRVFFHLEDGLAKWDWGKYASYFQGGTLIVSNRRGSNGYFEHVITANCDSLSIVIAGDQYTDNTTLRLYVYRINGEVQPKIVTVKKDGTGMFSTIRAAIDSITDANPVSNPYVIEVYPGTYDTLEGYTDEEIAATVVPYTMTSFVGPKLTSGMSLRGVGPRDQIILTAELDPNEWSYQIRGQISTLNIQGTGGIENCTIVGKYLRYCVHDDFNDPVNNIGKRWIKNVRFEGLKLAHFPFYTTYGTGMTDARDYDVEDCDFGFTFGIHTAGGMHNGCTIKVKNCKAHTFGLADYAANESNPFHHVIIENCDFDNITLIRTNQNVSCHISVEGVGCEDAKTYTDDGTTIMKLGNIIKSPPDLTVGKLVKHKSGEEGLEATDNKAIACGVVVGVDDVFSYVQRCGYIASNLLGFTGLSIGDYITVDNSGSLTTGGTAANAVGVVSHVDSSSIAFIKLLI